MERLGRRIRGGNAGHKGPRYEHFFAAHRVARLARKLFASGQDATIEWQAEEAVDDIVVRRDELQSFKGYQLKNTEQVSWTAGNPSIADDFILQRTLSEADGYQDIRLRLVCANPDVSRQLQEAVPERIGHFSKAISFPYGAVVMPALKEHPWLAEDFAFLSRKEDADLSETLSVAAVLAGAVWSLGNTMTVSQVLSQARQMSPQMLRVMPAEEAQAEAALRPELAALMNSWPDFSYGIIRGFLRWSAFSSRMEGILSMSCTDPKFAGWQQAVITASPASFEAIEGVFV